MASSSSRSSRKKEALHKLRHDKNNFVNSLEEYEVKDEGDIYQVVDEDEYQRLVESRRQREDFVVDDDGLGYYDDGEERLGDEVGNDDDDNNNKKSKQRKRGIETTAALTSAALKRARRTKALMTTTSRNKEQNDGDDDDGNNDEDQDDTKTSGGAKRNKSMWDFVQRGASASAIGAGTTLSSSSRANNNNNKPSTTVDFDSLLAGLDAVGSRRGNGRSSLSSSSTSHRTKSRLSGGKQQQQQQHRTQRSLASTTQRRGSTATAAARQKVSRVRIDTSDDQDYEDTAMAYDDNNDDFDDDPIVDYSPPIDDAKTAAVPSTDEVDTEMDVAKEEIMEDIPESNKVESNNSGEVQPLQRRRLAKKTITMSAPARKALEAQQQKQQQEKDRQTAAAAAAAAVVASQAAVAATTTMPMMIDASGTSFQPDSIAVDDSPFSSLSDETSAAQLEAVVLVDEASGHQYFDMFWMDVCERGRGEILLFGKAPLRDAPDTYVSCCVLIQNNVRNLFCLPRRRGERKKSDEESKEETTEEKSDNVKKADNDNTDEGEYESLSDVHAEINEVLKLSCIPKGGSWADRPVTRQYAFDDPTIPRQPMEYLKVVYDAKYPAPSPDVCANGGTFFAKILNSGASILETFILKRKLMGPCWIRIQQPMPNRALLSWCNLECHITDPKQLVRWDLAQKKGTTTHRPPPPIVTVSLKIKTIVNPKTHKSEVVSVSAICHKRVLLDTASDETTKHMTQLSLIRPLNFMAGHDHRALPQLPRDFDQEVKAQMPQLQRMPNERALLSRLLVQIGQWDPDVLVGHNAWGYDMQVLLTRSTELKVSTWSKFGRRRKTDPPRSLSTDFAIADVLVGRLLCDTYLSAKELLQETNYTLSSLAATQLKTSRVEIEPVDTPLWFESSKTIVQLAKHTLHDAQLVQRLLFKLQIIPLTKQLTCIAGNMWSKTIKGSRADRNEYLLLHEFHQLKILPPEKKPKANHKKKAQHDQQQPDNDGNANVEAAPASSNKAKYSGGLVLEPKKGLYHSFILLLDFNSLYPSIIQEYNLCFTTMDWAPYAPGAVPTASTAAIGNLPPLPSRTVEQGVLPRVIKSLVDRRRTVKKMLNSEKDVDKRAELDVRQKALKLTANSMYGCLGFSNSRFYAQPIAALVTAKGRETLQRTVDIAQNSIGLEVIYGDTDSIMINTRIKDPNELDEVMELGNKVKKEVNREYKTLELEIDGIFRSMLLLKKKKYAAVTVEITPTGPKYGKERKGLDLVRRDWCVQSKDTGEYVLDRILSGGDAEEIILNIHQHLEDLAKKMRAGELPLEKYVITKGLSKHPNDYPDGKSQPHVQVAKMMLQNNRAVNMGDHIPYIITAPPAADSEAASKSSADRARHPDDVARSGGLLKPDVEWYLTQQILPPVTRLCEPINGTSPGILAEKLGLDSSKYKNNNSRLVNADLWEEDNRNLIDFTPSSMLPDEERFKGVERLQFECLACGKSSEFPGVFSGDAAKEWSTGLECVNPSCPRPNNWGHDRVVDCMGRLSNAVAVLVHSLTKTYYQNEVICDDRTCLAKTRQLSVLGGVCLRRGCLGQMKSSYDERALHTQLTYLETLFDVDHACKKWAKKKIHGTEDDLRKSMLDEHKIVFNELKAFCTNYLQKSAFNWIDPSFWFKLFGNGQLSCLAIKE